MSLFGIIVNENAGKFLWNLLSWLKFQSMNFEHYWHWNDKPNILPPKNIIINFETLISGCLKYIVWSKIILLISVHIISDSSCPHYNKNSLKSGLLINYAVYKIPFYERTLQKYVYIFVHFLITEHEHYLLNNFEWRNKCNNKHRPEVKNEVLIYISRWNCI